MILKIDGCVWAEQIYVKENYRRIRKNGFGRLQLLSQDEPDSPRLYEDRSA